MFPDATTEPPVNDFEIGDRVCHYSKIAKLDPPEYMKPYEPRTVTAVGKNCIWLDNCHYKHDREHFLDFHECRMMDGKWVASK